MLCCSGFFAPLVLCVYFRASVLPLYCGCRLSCSRASGREAGRPCVARDMCLSEAHPTSRYHQTGDAGAPCLALLDAHFAQNPLVQVDQTVADFGRYVIVYSRIFASRCVVYCPRCSYTAPLSGTAARRLLWRGPSLLPGRRTTVGV